MYLIDTVVISELIRTKPDKKVINWISKIPESQLFVSVLTLGEIQKGIAKLGNSDKAKNLTAWMETEIVARFDDRILPITPKIATTWGHLVGHAERAGAPLPVIDSLLAATAAVHELVIATRNTTDIERAKVKVFNPWI